jgi:hypothetical protein
VPAHFCPLVSKANLKTEKNLGRTSAAPCRRLTHFQFKKASERNKAKLPASGNSLFGTRDVLIILRQGAGKCSYGFGHGATGRQVGGVESGCNCQAPACRPVIGRQANQSCALSPVRRWSVGDLAECWASPTSKHNEQQQHQARAITAIAETWASRVCTLRGSQRCLFDVEYRVRDIPAGSSDATDPL